MLKSIYLSNIISSSAKFALPFFFISVLISCNSNELIDKVEYFDETKKVKKEVYQVLKDQPGLKSGVFKSYYRDGKLKEELVFNNGALEEVKEINDISGKSIQKNSVKNGNGIYIRLDDSGKKIAEIEYKDGIPQGLIKYFDENEYQISEVHYEKGLPVRINTQTNISTDTENKENSHDTLSKKKDLPTVTGFDPKISESILNQLKNSEYDKLYLNSFSKLKQSQGLAEMKRYLGFLKEVYGQIKSFSMDSYELKSQSGVGEVLQVVYNTDFQFCKGQILIALAKDKDQFKLAGLDIAAAPYTPVMQVTKLGNPIAEKLKNKDYDGIYKNASPRFKSEAPYEQFIQAMKEVEKSGNFSSYSLEDHKIILVDKKLAIVANYKVKIGTMDANLMMNFIEENGSFILYGLNLQ